MRGDNAEDVAVGGADWTGERGEGYDAGIKYPAASYWELDPARFKTSIVDAPLPPYAKWAK